MAIELNFPPLGLSRIILNEKYKDYVKSDIKEMIKDQNLIPDSLLAANIRYIKDASKVCRRNYKNCLFPVLVFITIIRMVFLLI